MELLIKLISIPAGKLPFNAKEMALFVANDTFFNIKVVTFKKLINLLSTGKEPKN